MDVLRTGTTLSSGILAEACSTTSRTGHGRTARVGHCGVGASLPPFAGTDPGRNAQLRNADRATGRDGNRSCGPDRDRPR